MWFVKWLKKKIKKGYPTKCKGNVLPVPLNVLGSVAVGVLLHPHVSGMKRNRATQTHFLLTRKEQVEFDQWLGVMWSVQDICKCNS